MIVRIFQAVWFLSLLVVTGILLFQYASLPESVVVMEEGTDIFSIGRESFFYTVIGFISVVNVLVFIISKMYANDNALRSWFFGLIIAINFFLVISISFIALYNGGEKYDYSRLEYVLYFSVGLFVTWALLWPFYWGYKRISSKS